MFRGNNVAMACASLLVVWAFVTLVQIRCVCIQDTRGDGRLEVNYAKCVG